MPTNIIDSDFWTTTVQRPNAAEAASAASIANQFIQPLANRTLYLKNRILGAGASTEYEVPLVKPLRGNSGGYPTEWIDSTVGSGVGYGFFIQASVSAAHVIGFRLYLPRFPFQITGMRARAQGAIGTGHSAVPATVPRLILESSPLNAGGIPSITQHATAQQTYASVAAYDAAHDITTIVSGALPITHDPARAYFLRFLGETGAGSAANALLLMGLYLTMAAA